MGFWKSMKDIFQSSKKQASTPPPSGLIQQQQQIHTALNNLEREYIMQIYTLKQEAHRLLEQARGNYDKITEYHLLSTMESNASFKHKEAQFLAENANLIKIKLILENIADGDYSKVDELKNDAVFNEMFPNFNFKLYAAHAGLPECVSALSRAEADAEPQLALSKEEIKKSEEVKKTIEKMANLRPVFKPLTDRPLVERIAAVHAYYMLINNIININHIGNRDWSSKQKDIKDNGHFSNVTSLYTNENSILFLEGRYFNIIDNASRIAQLVINQHFDKQISPDASPLEISKVLALSIMSVKQAIKFQYPFGNFSFSEKNVESIHSDHHERIASACVFAGLVRRVCEKGTCGENIGEMILKGIEHISVLSEASSLLFSIRHSADKGKQYIELRNRSLQSYAQFDFESWIDLFTAYEENIKSGLYPFGDPKASIDAYNAVESKKERAKGDGRIRTPQEREQIKNNLFPVFKPLTDRPLIERLLGIRVLTFWHHACNYSKEYLPKLPEQYFEIVSNSANTITHESLLKTYDDYQNYFEGYYFTSIDNITRIVQIIMNQFFENLPYPNNNSTLTKTFALAMVVIEQALSKRNLFRADPVLENLNKHSYSNPYLVNLKHTIKGGVIGGLARRIYETGNYGENFGKLIKDAYFNCYTPIMPHAEKLFELTLTPTENRKALIEKWQAQGPIHFDLEDAQFLTIYKEIMLSGRYPLGAPQVLIEVQETQSREKAKLFMQEREKPQPLLVRIAGSALLECALNGLHTEKDLTILEKEYQRLASSINMDNNPSAIENDRLSKIALDVIDQVLASELGTTRDSKILIKALSLASVAVLHAVSPELSETETDAMIKAALFSGMARKLFIQHPENDGIHIKTLVEEIQTQQTIIATHFPQVESLLKLSQTSYSERLKLMEDLQAKNMAEFELEWADLTDCYLKVTQTKQFPIGDARILAEAEILRQNLEDVFPSRRPLLESPLTAELPSITEPWRNHKIQFKEQGNWETRIVTPEVLVHEAQQGRSILHKYRPYLIELIRSKISGPLFSERLPGFEEPSIILETSRNQYTLPKAITAPSEKTIPDLSDTTVPSATVQSTGFHFPQTEGHYFFQCIQAGATPKLYSKSVYVRNASFLKTSLPEFFVCGKPGKPHSIYLKASLSGKFKSHQGTCVISRDFEKTSQIKLTFQAPGIVRFSIQSKDYPSCESQSAIIYHAPINEKTHAFSAEDFREGCSFFFAKEKIANLNAQGKVEIWYEPIRSNTNEVLERKFKEHLSRTLSLFQNCDRKEKIAKAMMIVKRLLPHSLMFAPFLSVAGCLNEDLEALSIENFVTLLCQQVALCEILEQYGRKKTTQFIEYHSDDYPEHWSHFFNLTHQGSETEAIKGLFLQILQMHLSFLKSNAQQISTRSLFKLTRYLFALRSPSHMDTLEEAFGHYFKTEPNYEKWLGEVNAVLGSDTKSLQKLQTPIKRFLNERTEKFHHSLTKLGDVNGLLDSRYLSQVVKTGQLCLQGLENFKEYHRILEAGYAQNKEILQEALIQTNNNISEYYSSSYYAERQARNAQKKARRKQRICLIRNVVGLAVGAFLAPMIAPMLVNATGGLALAATKGALAGGISSAIGGRNIIKGTLQGAVCGGLGCQVGELVKPLDLAPAVSESLSAGATSLVSTAMNGGKVLPNLLVGMSTAALTNLCVDDPTTAQSVQQTTMMEVRDTATRIAITAGITTVCHKTDLASNLLAASLGTVQSIADKQGTVAANKIAQHQDKRKLDFLSKSEKMKPTVTTHNGAKKIPTKPTIPKLTQSRKTQGTQKTSQKEKPNRSRTIAAKKEPSNFRLSRNNPNGHKSSNTFASESIPARSNLTVNRSPGMESFLTETREQQFFSRFPQQSNTSFIPSAHASTPQNAEPLTFLHNGRSATRLQRMPRNNTSEKSLGGLLAAQGRFSYTIPARNSSIDFSTVTASSVVNGYSSNTDKISQKSLSSAWNNRMLQGRFRGHHGFNAGTYYVPFMTPILATDYSAKTFSQFDRIKIWNCTRNAGMSDGIHMQFPIGNEHDIGYWRQVGREFGRFTLNTIKHGQQYLKDNPRVAILFDAGLKVSDFTLSCCLAKLGPTLDPNFSTRQQNVQLAMADSIMEIERSYSAKWNLNVEDKAALGGLGTGVFFLMGVKNKGNLGQKKLLDIGRHSGARNNLNISSLEYSTLSSKLSRTTQAIDPKGYRYRDPKPDPGVLLDRKLRALEKAQKNAVKTQKFVDGRIRYYTAEIPQKTPGPTRGRSHVTEWNLNTGQVRAWSECYDQTGNVNRINPKMIDGQTIDSQHYPPTKSDLELFTGKLGRTK